MAARPYPASRTRRWLIAGTAVLLLLAGYAIALREASLWLGADVEHALRPAPVLEADTPRTD